MVVIKALTFKIKDFLFFGICTILSCIIVIGYDVVLFNDSYIIFLYYLGGVSGSFVYFFIAYFFFLFIYRLIKLIYVDRKHQWVLKILISVLYESILWLLILTVVYKNEMYHNSQAYHFFHFWTIYFAVFATIMVIQINISNWRSTNGNNAKKPKQINQ